MRGLLDTQWIPKLGATQFLNSFTLEPVTGFRTPSNYLKGTNAIIEERRTCATSCKSFWILIVYIACLTISNSFVLTPIQAPGYFQVAKCYNLEWTESLCIPVKFPGHLLDTLGSSQFEIPSGWNKTLWIHMEPLGDSIDTLSSSQFQIPLNWI